MKRLVLELDDKDHKKLKEKALKQDRSMRSILLDLLRKWLKKS